MTGLAGLLAPLQVAAMGGWMSDNLFCSFQMVQGAAEEAFKGKNILANKAETVTRPRFQAFCHD